MIKNVFEIAVTLCPRIHGGPKLMKDGVSPISPKTHSRSNLSADCPSEMNRRTLSLACVAGFRSAADAVIFDELEGNV